MARQVSQDPLRTGERPAALQALRLKLASALVEAEPREVATLAREFRAVLTELDALPAAEKSTSDDLAARRRDRRAKATGPDPASRGPVDERNRSGGTGG